jgi:hypothetical protein
MKIELQKESKWEVTINDFKDYYWIKVDGMPLDLAYDEQSALIKYNAFKEKYVKKEKETLLSEEFDGELPESKLITIETINK